MLPDSTGLIRHTDRLHELLASGDFGGLEALFRAFFASIPYNWHVNNDIARFEGYYASVFYSHFAAAGLDVRVEDATSRGRIDMAVRFRGSVYLFEFKVVELTDQGAALAQLKDRHYADKYRGVGKPIHLVGVEFSREERKHRRFRSRAWLMSPGTPLGYNAVGGGRNEADFHMWDSGGRRRPFTSMKRRQV